jgi:hypothetical protein
VCDRAIIWAKQTMNVSKTVAPKPNLFLVGAMKSATTYLSDLIREHPAVFMCSPKEPCHFVDQRMLRKAWPAMWEQGHWRSVARYLELFANAGDARVIAEASTTYGKAPMFSGVPERILDFNPDARFIYLMRDPVERAISHYWHRVRFWGEHRSIAAAIRSDPQYVDTSHYAMQLGLYLRHVSRERIYILTFEELLANPTGQIRDIYAWLGVNPAFQPNKLDIPANTMPSELDQVRGHGVLESLRRTPLYTKVHPYLPHSIRKVGTQLAVRRVKPVEVPVSAVKEYLRSIQLPQVNELSVLLERKFPEWKSLNGCDSPSVAAAESAMGPAESRTRGATN